MARPHFGSDAGTIEDRARRPDAGPVGGAGNGLVADVRADEKAAENC